MNEPGADPGQAQNGEPDRDANLGRRWRLGVRSRMSEARTVNRHRPGDGGPSQAESPEVRTVERCRVRDPGPEGRSRMREVEAA
jgi:hypothetical protein